MAITVRRLSKIFHCHGRTTRALDGLDLDIASGEMVALIGPSGSGKSTLLRHLSGLVCGDGGEVTVNDLPVQSRGRTARGIRTARAGIGMIFQQFNLVSRLDLLTNVCAGMLHRIPLWRSLPGWFTSSERHHAMEALHRVGMSLYAAQRASTLSGGQQQRAAIARALVQGARTILGDEPIASLDPGSARTVMETLARINREDRVTVVVSLHQVDFAIAFCPRTVALKDGRIVYDGPSRGLTPDVLSRIYGSAAATLTAPSEPVSPPPTRHPVLEPALV
jgi:phosphonate transport system ATP-binding protein